MEEAPKLGDIIRIASPNGDFKLFTVVSITPNKMSLKDLIDSGVTLELINYDGSWRVPNTNVNYNIDIVKEITLTGIEQIDANILLQLDDDTLNVMCYDKNNKYTSNICNNNYFWTQKIHKLFPRLRIPEQYDNQHRMLYNEIKLFSYQDLFNWAIEKGYLNVLGWTSNRGIRFFDNDIRILMRKGYIDILEWLLAAGLEPTVGWANLAAAYGHLNILELLTKQGIYPNLRGINSATRYGQLDVVKWLTERKLYPDIKAVNLAVEYGHSEILQWLAQYNIYPDFNGANLAAKYARLALLQWLSEHNIYPNIDGANAVSTYPSPSDHDFKALNPTKRDSIGTLNWLAQHDIYPDQDGADGALEHNDEDVVEWLAQHRIYPHLGIINEFIVDSRESIIILMKYGIYPTQEGANLAAESQDIDMLKLLAQHNIYPTNGY